MHIQGGNKMLFVDRGTVRDTLTLAMNNALLRNEVINHNIANADTPGFTRSVVEFELFLNNEIERARNQGGPINLGNVQPPTVHFSTEILAHRLDGNNVDIEMEMVHLFQNSTRYEVLSLSMMANSQRIDTVMNSNI